VSETLGYADVKCQIGAKGCQKKNAGYSRRKQYAQQGPWLDACENCARIPYEQPAQFKSEPETVEAF
jgi:hypothetical protein